MRDTAQLVLLPGMDGTGDLFRPFVEALPREIEAKIIRYPRHEKLSSPDLLRLISDALDLSRPYFLLAESFSTPLAIQLAASQPENLRGLILCNGFAETPIHGSIRTFAKLLSPILFRLSLPDFAIRRWLVDRGTPDQLLRDVRSAIASVSPDVLSHRLFSILGCTVRENLSVISSPTLFIRGANDRLVEDALMENQLTTKDKAEVVVIDGPHLLLQCNAAEAAIHIAKFIGKYSSHT